MFEKINIELQQIQAEIFPWLLKHGLKIALFVVGGILLNKVIKKIVIRSLQRTTLPDAEISHEAEEKRKRTLIRILNGAISIIIAIIVIMMVLQEFQIQVGPILASLGVVGLAVGFGGQYLIRDVIAGLFIIIENQFRIGDFVKLDNVNGIVEDISLRMTTLRDLDGTVHHLSNGEIKLVSNMSKHFTRVNINIGVAYHTDIGKLIAVINQVGEEMANDPEWGDKILKKPEFLRIEDFADSAMVVKILGEVIPLQKLAIAGELRKRLKIAFDKNNIQIPFPQVVVHQVSHQNK